MQKGPTHVTDSLKRVGQSMHAGWSKFGLIGSKSDAKDAKEEGSPKPKPKAKQVGVSCTRLLTQSSTMFVLGARPLDESA